MQVNSPLSKLWTLTEICKKTGESIWRVQYILKTRKILPIHRIGPARVYSEEQYNLICDELRKLNEQRGGHDEN